MAVWESLIDVINIRRQQTIAALIVHIHIQQLQQHIGEAGVVSTKIFKGEPDFKQALRISS